MTSTRSGSGLRARVERKLAAYKPQVVSTFVVYVTARTEPDGPGAATPTSQGADAEFEIVEIHSPDDPLLERVCHSRRQLSTARESIRKGAWDVIVALRDGEPVGRIWEAFGTERRLLAGVPRFRLADDEFYMFDLFVEREHRRSSVAFLMADHFFAKYPIDGRYRYGYGYIAYDNVPSILWHDATGFRIAQTVNLFQIGPYIKWRIPFSDVPRVGPLSRRGRHNDPAVELFGPRLMS